MDLKRQLLQGISILLVGFTLLGCGSTKIVKETIIETKTDTVIVYVPEKIDTVDGIEGLLDDLGAVITGTVIEDGDTVIVIHFVQGDTTFIVKSYPDTFIIETVRVDTVTNNLIMEEPTMLEQWWWLILAVLGAVVLILILIKFK